MHTLVSRLICGAVFVGLLVSVWHYGSESSEWKIAHDTPLLHFMASEVIAGKVPFRDTIELNTPFAVFLHVINLRVFGRGDADWVRFQYFWLALTAVSFVVCLAPRWVAALGAFLVYAILMFKEGFWVFGQRDFYAVPFLVFSVALSQRATTTSRMWLVFAAGLALGIAAAIKPQFFLIAFLLGGWMIHWAPTRLGFHRVVAFLLASGIPWICVLLYLALHGALGPFFEFLLHYLVPVYSGLGHQPLRETLTVLGKALFIFFPLVLLRRGFPEGAEPLVTCLLVLLLGTTAVFVLQGKGWLYQALPGMACMCLVGALRVSHVLGGSSRRYLSDYICILLVLYLLSPLFNDARASFKSDISRVVVIQNSIRQHLPPNGKIQALDLTGGALNAMYRERLSMATPFIYDFFLYNRVTNPYVRKLNRRFFESLEKECPDVILVTSFSWPDLKLGYRKIEQIFGLPEFLAEHYQKEVEEFDFRLYRLRDGEGCTA